MKKQWRKNLAAMLFALPVMAGGVQANIELVQLGSYETGLFAESASEITAYDAASKRLFVVNAIENTVDILDMSNPALPTKITTINGADYGGGINSVTVNNGIVAFASQASVKTDNGKVVFTDINGSFIHSVEVGALPDMLTFTPDGKKILVANEGELPENAGVNPKGTVSVIDISGGVASASVTRIGFEAFDASLQATSGDDIQSKVRIHPNADSASSDIEPEYIAISSDGTKAYVSLQENNAIAVIDLTTNEVTHVLALGVKDHGKADSGFISYDGVNNSSNGLDVSDRDNAINIRNWAGVYGIYMPDAIATYEINGRTYVLTANEGDDRGDWEGFEDSARVKDLDTGAAFNGLRGDTNLGRLTVSTIDGKTGGVYNSLYTLGGRSFSIWDVTDPSSWGYDPVTGNMTGLVYDSGDDFEQIVKNLYPEYFNFDNEENDTFDNRSDNKGPEPEGVTVGWVDGRWYAFIGLERVGGVMVYDITDPLMPSFIQYLNLRNFDENATDLAMGESGPEGLLFIDALSSPTGNALLVVANEVSGTTTVYSINSLAQTPAVPEPASAALALAGLGAAGLAASRRGRRA